MNLNFHKYEALGNDYLILAPSEWTLLLTSSTIEKLCDRRLGIGADGLLVGPYPSENGFALRIFNADGSECKKSGNGLRIFAQYLCDAGYVSGSNTCIHLLATGEDILVHFLSEDQLVCVELGGYSFDAIDIPVCTKKTRILNEVLKINEYDLRISCVHIGNPHCVVFGPHPTEELARNLGPRIGASELFPEKTNVHFVNIMARNLINMEAWERGAGYTLASGNGASAAVVICRQLDFVDDDVIVQMPGGQVRVKINSVGKISITGSARAIYSGRLASSFGSSLSMSLYPGI